MHSEQRLFDPLPSHLYVSAHWTPSGWYVTLTTSSQTRLRAESSRQLYEHLSGEELVDAVAGGLASALRL